MPPATASMPPPTASQAQSAPANHAVNHIASEALNSEGINATAVNSLSAKIREREGLQATFELFNRMSDDLSTSYRALETQVSSLSDELNRVNQQRELELKSTQQVTDKLSNLLDLLPGGVIVLDRWGVVSQVNPATEELLDHNLVGKKWVDIIAEYFAPQDDDWHEISLKCGRRVSLSTRSLESETGQIILLTDQTETRHLQQQVSRNERLSALGRMVSAMAHQIRTPLSAAMLYASHLSDQTLTSEQTQRFSQKIVSRLNNLEQQVRDMLVFVKGDIKLADSATLGEIIDDLQSTVDVDLAANQATLSIENPFADAQLICNRQTMVGALGNLVQNALQASPLGSVIKVRTTRQSRGISIVIEDSGCGIPADILSRVDKEEAFVTTKSQGTGLGLAVVRAVVKAHNGTVSVSSVEQQGTEVRITLPCAPRSLPSSSASLAMPISALPNASPAQS